jgi:hypothetical protein
VPACDQRASCALSHCEIRKYGPKYPEAVKDFTDQHPEKRYEADLTKKPDNLVGHTLEAQDNDTYMYEDGDPSLEKCTKCGYRVDFLLTNPDYVLRKRSRDLSATYDGQFIVSKRFKDFAEQEGYRGASFVPFRNDPEHFHLIAKPIVVFDAERRKTRFEKKCDVCGNFESVVGAYPAYLRVDEPLADDFFRTDLVFASGNEKSPIIVVGEATKRKLQQLDLKGLEFGPAYGLSKRSS